MIINTLTSFLAPGKDLERTKDVSVVDFFIFFCILRGDALGRGEDDILGEEATLGGGGPKEEAVTDIVNICGNTKLEAY